MMRFIRSGWHKSQVALSKFRTRAVLSAVVATAAVGTSATRGDSADDLLKQTAPYKWIDPLIPEKLPPLTFIKDSSDLEKAKVEVFHGRYKQTLITLSKVHAEKPQDAVDFALTRAQALDALGRQEAALRELSDEKVAADPQVQVRRATLLSAMGRLDQAVSLLKEVIAAHPDSIAAHYELGAVSERIGDTASAKAAFGWFVEKPQDFLERWQMHERNAPFDNGRDVTTIGRALDRWATLNEKYRNNSELDKTFLNIFVRSYDVIDRGYWPAHVAAGEYFMSHDQAQEAAGEFTAALKANPNDLRSAKMMGMIALEHFSFEGAEQAIAAIRAVNPNSIDADILETRDLLLQRRPEFAFAPIQRVLDAQPKNLEGMGLLAAIYGLQLKDAKAAEVLQQVDQIDPNNASAYFEVAQQFSAMRQYPRSAAMYKKAIERAPWWTAARNGLGLLYTQSGDEDLAHTVLNEARQLDPYNLATTNYIKLLDDMDHFARKESAHFIVMYDPKLDPVIPEYFNDYLESVHKQICETFKFEPAVKTYIEVFPTHDAFSVRTTGSPWIGTVGASTGRVIALVSPRPGQGTMGTFNWAQVLRHEYTHTVTLGATDNRIQHWMTEGLAVYEERTPMRWEWVPMLYNAVKKHELFPIDQLTWSFVRPKRPIDRQLAYAESYWICKYIEETYGHDTILRMLSDFHDAEPQEVAFPKETKKSLSDFQNDFFAWCEATVAKWGYDPDTSRKYKEMVEKADAMLKGRDYKEAVDLWEQIAAMRPVDELPHKRLAGLYLLPSINQPEKAADELVLLSKVELKDNRYAKRVARVYRDMNKMEEAANYALLAVYTSPYDLSAHELLKEIDEKAGDHPASVERETRVIEVIKKMQARTAAEDRAAEKNAGR
ncbi:MAG TPA: tetratricopeptide repeat protein [Tepidisphaeraceae bacterium]|jgi:tetratricopeptide (TPR) repeat protein|nr:tetratricopeptide repeat protein [Tepidisphaeraceae bacterium]